MCSRWPMRFTFQAVMKTRCLWRRHCGKWAWRHQSKHYDSAYNDFTELLKVVPNDVDTLNNLAFMLADAMKRPKDAINFAKLKAPQMMDAHGRRTHQCDCDHGHLYDTLGWCSSRMRFRPARCRPTSPSSSMMPKRRFVRRSIRNHCPRRTCTWRWSMSRKRTWVSRRPRCRKGIRCGEAAGG